MTSKFIPHAIVAIPARNEVSRIGACLAALSMQRGIDGAPLDAGAFSVVVLANGCSDGTVAAVRAFEGVFPFDLRVIECDLKPWRANAGGARRAAMDAAADILEANAGAGLVLTTDADSRAAPTWVDACRRAVAAGCDAVAGYVDADASEHVALGRSFVGRGRLEDRYLALSAELQSILDPRPHDPWPNHRAHSGANFGVTLAAYRAIGGLPPLPLGEDVALADALERAGLLLRHSMDAVVTTSCRFDSRAPGGAGDTMRLRHTEPDAPCDREVETASALFRRALARGRLRRLHDAARSDDACDHLRRLGIPGREAAAIVEVGFGHPFAIMWERVEAGSRGLRRVEPLRPSQLHPEIGRLETLLRRLASAGLSADCDRRVEPGRVDGRGGTIPATTAIAARALIPCSPGPSSRTTA